MKQKPKSAVYMRLLTGRQLMYMTAEERKRAAGTDRTLPNVNSEQKIMHGKGDQHEE